MFQSTHIMTDDGGIDIKHHKTIHALTDTAQNDYNMQMDVNKYSCTAIFGNVLCNIQSSIVICANDHIPGEYRILISTPDPHPLP